jgi:ABC-type uncharacterized transport system substrate-binding protein
MARLAGTAVSISMPVPVDTQVAVFRNIWKLDRNVDGAKEMTLGIVYQENYADSVAAKDDFIAAMAKQNLRVTIVSIESSTDDRLSKRLHDVEADVIYVAPLRAVDVSAIGRISRFRRMRTITGVPEYVEQGLAVGVGIRKDRPLIIVNLEQSRAEGSSFSSQLLALARIVGPVQ